MLDRYKKKGGFVQLLTLIETSNKQKQDQFLNLIAQENTVWETAIKQKMLSLERILGWNSIFLSEIFGRTQPLTLATVLHGMPTDKVESILGCLSMSDQRKIQLTISERNPTASEKATCIMKIISEVRGYSLSGILKLDKIDPELAIPENYEEKLNNQALNDNYADTVITDTSAAEKNSSDGTTLDFSKADKLESRSSENHKDEIEFLKRKVNQLVQENNTLKHDLTVARGKLEQIRKIA